VPPTPGHAIVTRPANSGLYTIGQVLRDAGYSTQYLYGGYATFDNMRDFFGGNGYTVIDRSAIASERIHHETIWGVADEDLFEMALEQLDAQHATDRPFFAHIMTTSNHRPFTYPEGRIDIPSKSGRAGGVKYTDYAVGGFIKAARSKPWAANTLFVIVADHTHNGRGKQELPPQAYHIPLIMLAPHLKPTTVDTLSSQIDVAPTILGILGLPYTSRFFGQDILTEGSRNPRAFLANYQTVGLYRDGWVVELKPQRRVRLVKVDEHATEVDEATLVEEAIAHYQVAASAFKRGWLRAAPP
jgi:phosphoglycerol transferase MdoB-like AlkP superfamily enzyme